MAGPDITFLWSKTAKSQLKKLIYGLSLHSSVFYPGPTTLVTLSLALLCWKRQTTIVIERGLDSSITKRHQLCWDPLLVVSTSHSRRVIAMTFIPSDFIRRKRRVYLLCLHDNGRLAHLFCWHKSYTKSAPAHCGCKIIPWNWGASYFFFNKIISGGPHSLVEPNTHKRSLI
jgi:hypothetical protein